METQIRHIIPFTGGLDSACVLATVVQKLKQEGKDENIICSYVRTSHVLSNIREFEAINKTIDYMRYSYDYDNIILTTHGLQMNNGFKGTEDQKDIMFKRFGYEMIPFYVVAVIFALGIHNNLVYLPFNKQDYYDSYCIGVDSIGLINRIKKVILDLSFFSKHESVEIFLPLIDMEKHEVISKLYTIEYELAREVKELNYFSAVDPSSCQNKTECISFKDIIKNVVDEKERPKDLCVKCKEIYDAIEKLHERRD